MRRFALFVAIVIGTLLVAAPVEAAKPGTTILYQDHYSVLTHTAQGGQQVVALTSTFPDNTRPAGATAEFYFLANGVFTTILPGQTLTFPRNTKFTNIQNSYPTLILYQENDGCRAGAGLCVHGEYGPTDTGNDCFVYVENPTEAVVTVTLHGPEGFEDRTVTAEPGQTSMTTYEDSKCPTSASV